MSFQHLGKKIIDGIENTDLRRRFGPEEDDMTEQWR
jgi:hypothetical protein